jgi:hypothetical protein
MYPGAGGSAQPGTATTNRPMTAMPVKPTARADTAPAVHERRRARRGKGRVVGKGPFEVLLVAPEGHQIRRAAEELDYVGRELASQSRFLRPEPALACPRRPLR